MGKLFLESIVADETVYVCGECRTDLAQRKHLVSRNFRGSFGKAILFESVVNVTPRSPRERDLLTGRHLVADVSCSNCASQLGWTYLKAYEDSQKYKENKTILECERVLVCVCRRNEFGGYDEHGCLSVCVEASDNEESE